ncbi:hypothetical protein [Streptomyces phaeoluteigriseus]|uniref:hypothetical protein n=1 Tax=Streptomyces phaeoluteigriseus TaxID=114686 RepID=UPI00369181EA
MRGAIWFGDVVRALEVADTDEARQGVARLLGFELHLAPGDNAPPPRRPTPPSADPLPWPPHDPHLWPDEEPPDAPASEDPAEPTDQLAELPLLRPAHVRERGHAGPAVPQGVGEPLAKPTDARVPLPHQPLLVPRWTGAIVRALLSRPVPEGPVDIPALIDTMAHERPVTALPRLPVPTLRYGVQVLVDRGAGMQPFRRDQDELLRRIRAVVGPALVEVGYFSDAPQRGTGPGPRWTRTDYRPPQTGRRVLVLSDLGLGGPPDHDRGTHEEWTDFARLIRRAGCGAVALSPYPAHRWAAWMPRVLPLVAWDRTTRPGHVGRRRA